MASSSTSSRERSWIHDVFLSFRGTDTRLTFTSHLYRALDNAGVRTFMDDTDLERGCNISEALIRAIQGSRISVVVLSENYASSRWCLDELVCIMKCRRELEQKVFPIFCHVDPSDVRHQKGDFGKAFEKHEAPKRLRKQGQMGWRYAVRFVASERHEALERQQKQDEISRRRSALRDVANLSGWDLSASHYGNEAKCIKEIVDSICRMLNNTYLHVAVYPVGIQSRIKDICKSLSDGKENDVRMVGIWGMGGSGKTSLAKAVYNKFYHTFENKSFLGNVRETVKESSNGKITLQERLLSDILKPTKIEVSSADQGIVVITESLGSKKVFVIVDDVDEMDQLIALAIRHDSFGPGSRIVITTRDRHVLELLNVDKIHETREMKEEEALELFSWHAFHNPCPDDFLKLTRRVVTYCKGLPLALEVLGSFLFNRSEIDWKDTLKNLEKFPDRKIDNILKISFDALDDDWKEIFLHICCFFVGMDRKYATEILYGCGHSSVLGISVLVQRCLVTVSERNKLMMHDLLRDMGREVVRVASPKEPEERSRLWRQEDVINVLTEESGTKQIEGLALNLQRSDEKTFRTIAFQKMQRLRLLQLNYVQLDGDYDHLTKQLRWLCWRGFSLPTIQNDFLNEQNLVSIDLRHSNLVQVWEQSRLLKKLKILILSHSHYLKQTPDFSNLPNLEYLILKDCKSLSEIHASIGHLGRLILVNFKDCIMIKDLPESFYNLKSVETLDLSGCSRFQELSDDIGNMTALATLRVRGTAISQVPSCLGRLKLDYSSRQDLILVKQRFPDVPRNQFRVLQVLTANGESDGFNDYISPGDYSNLERMYINYYSSILNRDPATEELEADYYSNAVGVARNFSETQMQSILQGLTAMEVGGISLSGNDFPEQSTKVGEKERVLFQVPQIIGCNLEALNIRVVCSFIFSDDMSPSRDSIIVTNRTKRVCFVVRPAYPTGKTSHEVIWQENLLNNKLKLEGGDFIEVETAAGLRVKKTRVSLVWDPNLITENTIECETIPHENFRSNADNQAGPSNASSDYQDRPSKGLKLPMYSDNQAGPSYVSSDYQDRPSKDLKLPIHSDNQTGPNLVSSDEDPPPKRSMFWFIPCGLCSLFLLLSGKEND